MEIPMNDIDSTPAPPAATPKGLPCPKCGTPRDTAAEECASCGIIFAKWRPRAAASPADRAVGRNTARATASKRSAIPLIAGALAFLLLAVGGWWLTRPEPLAANEILVTYDNGESCKWTDWSFRYRRAVQNNRAMGNALMVGPPSFQVEDDTTLRVFDAYGGKLEIPGEQIREMRLTTVARPENSGYNRAISITVETADGSHRFSAEELPKFSRSRVLVPVASHYFPEQSDDYMSWGNVRLTLAGTVPPECGSSDEISLTGTDHSRKHTPAQITFSGV
jgi:hypothetical protein